MKKFIFIFILFLIQIQVLAQVCVLSGKVSDWNTGKPIKGAAVSLLNTSIGELTDSIGKFSFCHLEDKEYKLLINYIGYESDTISVNLKNEVVLNVQLRPISITLKEVSVVVTHSRNVILDKPEVHFSRLLDQISGTTIQSIGSSSAKPIVRGLGFNRVAVINKGIVQQNQQWGADHGMQINQFDMESATVYKGPNSLLLGSASMTAIEIESFKFKDKDFYSGEAVLWGASNNDQFGGALTTTWQKKKWYIRGAFNYQDYADYRVPADYFSHDKEDIALPDKRIPNTAGKEFGISGTLGYKEKDLTTYLSVSNNYTKTGIFELPHHHEEHEGEEHHHDHDFDTSHRNIGMPYATSNHFSVTNNTEWRKSPSFRLLVNTGYQNNHRKEMEHFHEHYEGQPEPMTDDDIAVDFKLDTYSTNARLYLDANEKWEKIIGASVEYQQNRIGGFEFFLPRYNQILGSFSFVNHFRFTDKLRFGAGLRYDIGHIDITGYYDETMAEYLTGQGYEPQIVQQYAQRAFDVDRNNKSWSGNIGFNYKANDELTIKLQIARSFRFPAANELAANGVHHAAFRYEIGDPGLNPEYGYTTDFGIHYDNGYNLQIDLSPFLSYYSNFIYLQAVQESPLDMYDTQPYKYSQAKAIYGGGEYSIVWRGIKALELSSRGDLVLNENLDSHEPLPLTPPFTMNNEVKYISNTNKRTGITYWQVSASHQWYANQNRVGSGEEKTRGTNLFNVGTGFDYKFNSNWSVLFNMQFQNIFNTRYFNHMSLYRRLNIPEPGRNIQIFIRVPFSS